MDYSLLWFSIGHASLEPKRQLIYGLGTRVIFRSEGRAGASRADSTRDLEAFLNAHAKHVGAACPIKNSRPLKFPFDSTLHAEFALDDGAAAVIGLQKGSFAPIEATSTPAPVESVSIDVAAIPSRSKILAIAEAPTGDVDITKAEIVVSVGRGIGTAEKIPLIAELAEALGGVLACSRPVVDVGWLPRERQVEIGRASCRERVYVLV